MNHNNTHHDGSERVDATELATELAEFNELAREYHQRATELTARYTTLATQLRTPPASSLRLPNDGVDHLLAGSVARDIRTAVDFGQPVPDNTLDTATHLAIAQRTHQQAGFAAEHEEAMRRDFDTVADLQIQHSATSDPHERDRIQQEGMRITNQWTTGPHAQHWNTLAATVEAAINHPDEMHALLAAYQQHPASIEPEFTPLEHRDNHHAAAIAQRLTTAHPRTQPARERTR